jgi:hypothetical protein
MSLKVHLFEIEYKTCNYYVVELYMAPDCWRGVAYYVGKNGGGGSDTSCGLIGKEKWFNGEMRKYVKNCTTLASNAEILLCTAYNVMGDNCVGMESFQSPTQGPDFPWGVADCNGRKRKILHGDWSGQDKWIPEICLKFDDFGLKCRNFIVLGCMMSWKSDFMGKYA